MTHRASKIQGEPVSRAMKPEVVNIPVPIMLAITTAAAVRHRIVRLSRPLDSKVMAGMGQVAQEILFCALQS